MKKLPIDVLCTVSEFLYSFDEWKKFIMINKQLFLHVKKENLKSFASIRIVYFHNLPVSKKALVYNHLKSLTICPETNNWYAWIRASYHVERLRYFGTQLDKIYLCNYSNDDTPELFSN